MVRAMRRRQQQVNDQGVLAGWLNDAVVGRLATVDEDGYPVIKPVNYVYADGKIFFHCARQGEKLDDMRRDARVGFEVDEVLAVSPPPGPGQGCRTHCFYQSIIIRGRARFLDETADAALWERALRLLVQKYAPPGYADGPLDTSNNPLVVEISIEQMTGKEDFGQNWTADRKLAVAQRLRERDGDRAEAIIARMGVGGT